MKVKETKGTQGTQVLLLLMVVALAVLCGCVGGAVPVAASVRSGAAVATIERAAGTIAQAAETLPAVPERVTIEAGAKEILAVTPEVTRAQSETERKLAAAEKEILSLKNGAILWVRVALYAFAVGCILFGGWRIYCAVQASGVSALVGAIYGVIPLAFLCMTLFGVATLLGQSWFLVACCVGTVATVLCVGAYFARDVWVARTREAWDNESEGVVRVMAETMDEVCGKETSGATVSVMEYKAALAEKMTPAQKLYIEAARKKLPIP